MYVSLRIVTLGLGVGVLGRSLCLVSTYVDRGYI